MRLFYYSKSGIKFNPILDKLDWIADIFIPNPKLYNPQSEFQKPNQSKGVVYKHETTNIRHFYVPIKSIGISHYEFYIKALKRRREA